MVKSFLLIFYVSLSALLLGNNPMVNYSRNDGLPSVETYKILQDHRGYIWIGTDRGLSRFDGYEFKNYTLKEGLPSNVIIDLFQDQSNRLWAIHRHYHPTFIRDDSIMKVNLSPEQENEISNLILRNIKESKAGDILIIYHSSLVYRYLPESNTMTKLFDFKSRERHMPVFYYDEVYGYIFNAGLNLNYPEEKRGSHYLLTGNQADFIEKPISTSRSFKRAVITNFLEYDSLAFFCLMRDSSIYVLRGTSIEVKLNLPSDHTSKFGYDKNRDFWVGLFDKGVAVYPNGNFDLPPKHLLDGYTVTSRLVDREGNYWYSTLSNGIFLSPNEKVKYFTMKSFGENKLRSIGGYKDQLYFNSEQRRMYQVPSGKRFYPEKRINRILSFDDTSLLVSSSRPKSVLRIHGDESLSEEFLNFPVDDIIITDTLTYVSYRRRLYFFHPNEREYFSYYQLNKYIYGIEEHDDVIYVATDQGVYFIDSLKVKKLELGLADLEGRISGLQSLDDSLLLISTMGKGLFFYQDGKVIQKIDQNTGLSSDLINGIYLSHKHEVFIFGNDGISKLLPPFNEAEVQLQNYRSIDGIGWKDIIGMHVFQDSLWLASRNGITLYHLDDYKIPAVKPEMKIRKVFVNQELHPIDQLMELNYDQNNLEIGFNAISFRSLRDLQYRYRLNGGNWNHTKLTSIVFPQLNPGNYTLELEAINPWGQKSDLVALPFIIQPPFWLEPWFIAFELILLGCLIYFFLRWRIRTIKKAAMINLEKYQNKHLALNAQLNPHFIFNSLNAIDQYVLKNNIRVSSRYVKSFAKLMRQTLENSKSHLVSLEVDLEILKEYVKLELLRMNEEINVVWEIDPSMNLKEIYLPPMLLQPFVENCFQHAFTEEILHPKLSITIKREKDFLFLKLEDNGIGRNASQKQKTDRNNHQSSGEAISQARIELFNKLYHPPISFEIIDIPSIKGSSGGTSIIFNIPLKLKLKALENIR